MEIKNMKSGSVIFCRSNSLLSKSIRFITRKHWSHVAIYLIIDGYEYIIEAQPNGIVLKPYEFWKEKWKYETHTLYKEVDEEKLRVRALSKSDTKYDFKAIGKHIIKSATGYWRNEGKNENERMTCSEFVGWCFYIPEWWKLNPGEIYDYMINNGWYENTL